MIVIRRASSRTVKLCPAAPALVSCVKVVACAEYLYCLRVCDTLVDIADDHIIITDNLVTWIEIPCRRYCKLLSCNAAASDSFVNARSAGQIDSIVIEVESFASFPSVIHFKSELFIFIEQLRQVLLMKSIRNIRR